MNVKVSTVNNEDERSERWAGGGRDVFLMVEETEMLALTNDDRPVCKEKKRHTSNEKEKES